MACGGICFSVYGKFAARRVFPLFFDLIAPKIRYQQKFVHTIIDLAKPLSACPFKNKITVGNYIAPAHSVFAFSFSFPKDESNQQRTYLYLFVFYFKMRKNLSIFWRLFLLLMFPLKLLIVCSLCMAANRLCPEAPTTHKVQLLFATTICSCCMPLQPLPTLPSSSTHHGYCKNW